MVAILIVAHAPLASALQALARHTYTECSAEVAAVVAAGVLEITGVTVSAANWLKPAAAAEVSIGAVCAKMDVAVKIIEVI